jgi:hypothetical protein
MYGGPIFFLFCSHALDAQTRVRLRATAVQQQLLIALKTEG